MEPMKKTNRKVVHFVTHVSAHKKRKRRKGLKIGY